MRRPEANEHEQVLRLDDDRLGVHDRNVLREIYMRIHGYAPAKPNPYLTRVLFATDSDLITSQPANKLDGTNMEPPTDDAA